MLGSAFRKPPEPPMVTVPILNPSCFCEDSFAPDPCPGGVGVRDEMVLLMPALTLLVKSCFSGGLDSFAPALTLLVNFCFLEGLESFEADCPLAPAVRDEMVFVMPALILLVNPATDICLDASGCTLHLQVSIRLSSLPCNPCSFSVTSSLRFPARTICNWDSLQRQDICTVRQIHAVF